MKGSKKLASLLSLFIFINITHAESVTLSDGSILPESFETVSGGKKSICAGPVKAKYLPGKFKTLNGNTVFIPLSEDLSGLKKKKKSATSASVKSKLTKKIDTLKSKIKTLGNICNKKPVPGKTPNATPTTVPGNFDSKGNVTDKGKLAFGIPSNLSANIFSGDTLYQRWCSECHSYERKGKTFSFYKAVSTGSPVFLTNLSDQDFANITAYLRQDEKN